MQGKRSLARGGARNSALRQSRHLSRHQCEKLLDAAERALSAGLPFNRFVTIVWEHGGIPPSGVAKATGAFIKRLADWLRPFGYRLAWAWVQENCRRNGAHVHLLLHIPPALDPLFRALPLRWVKALLPGRYSPGLLDTQRIFGARHMEALPALYRANLDRKLCYMMKAAEADVGAAYGLPRSGEGCTVIGKRLAVWQRRTRG